MAKNDKQKLFDSSMNQVNNAESNYSAGGAKMDTRGDTTWDRGTEDYNNAFKGYQDFQNNGGLSQADIDRMRGAYGGIGGGGGGGISNPLSGKSSNYAGLSSAYGSAYRPDYGESDTGFRKLTGASGGFDQGKLDQIYGNIDTLSGIGRTGGITDEDKSNINRQSLLDTEANGGYSDADRAFIRAKSSASAPAYFSALKDNLQRNRSITGNLAGAGAVDFKLARQAAQQQGQDRLNTEIGLGDSIRAGRMDAGKFLSDQNMQLAGLRTSNQLQGASNAASQGTNTQQAITGNQLAGLRGLQDSQTGLGQWGLGQAGGLDQFSLNRAGGMDSWDMNNAQMDMSAASSNASAARANQAANAEFEKWLTTYGNANKQYGIEGMNDLYKTNLGASQNYSGMGIDNLNSKFGAQGNAIQQATQNRGRTLMENVGTIGNVVGSVAGAATGLGGLAGLGGSPGVGSGGGFFPGGSSYNTADYRNSIRY